MLFVVEFFQKIDFLVSGVRSEVIQIRVIVHVIKIIVPQQNGRFQGVRGFFLLSRQGIAAAQIIVSQRIFGLQSGDTQINIEPFRIKSSFRVV